MSRPVNGVDGASVFLVDDTLAALQDLAAAWRLVLGVEVLGITGSVGKTTTKRIAAALLASRYRVQANPLNYNNEISVPLCLLELRPDTERAVIEMGMYTTGEIARLCRWARPRSGIVLNVGPTHLERAGSIENIARAKRELPEALPADGHAVLNADDPLVREMASHTRARVWWFGTSDSAHVRGIQIASRGVEGFDFTLAFADRRRRLRVALPGAHLVSNVLAAAAAALADGVGFDAVGDAIEALDVPTRMRVLRLRDGITLIDDTYNAQPASMTAALDLLGGMPGRHVALLGEMLELGPASADAHAATGRRAAASVDVLFTIGAEAAVLRDAARDAGLATSAHLHDRGAVLPALKDVLRAGDVLLIKGSHALGLDEVAVAVEREYGGVGDLR